MTIAATPHRLRLMNLPLLAALIGASIVLVLALLAARWLQGRPFSRRQLLVIIPIGLSILAPAMIAGVERGLESPIGWPAFWLLGVLGLLGLATTTLTDLRGREVYVEPLYGLAFLLAGLWVIAQPGAGSLAGELLFGRGIGFIGLLVCGGAFMLLHLFGRLIGHFSGLTERAVAQTGEDAREAIMGSGDMAVAALIGAWLGAVLGIGALIVGVLAQLPLIVAVLAWKYSSSKRREQMMYIPYVPGMALGALLTWFEPRILGWVFGLFG